MQLVIKYTVSDGCTYSCDVTQPVLYESAEAFIVDFENFCHENRIYDILKQPVFAGIKWCPDEFFENDIYYSPDILTVDEWFKNYAGDK